MKYITPLLKSRFLNFLALILILCTAPQVHATNVVLVNSDSANEGFNSNEAPFPNQTGNTGSTLGQQRLNVFQAAADYWEQRINSTVTIRVQINFDPLFCEPNRATLGSAGPNAVFRDFPSAPLSNTWYVEAVANSITGADQDSTSNDISATFNSDIDNNNNCLDGTNWWLGIDSPAPSGTISLFDTVLHEIGHGIGFLSLVSASGERFSNFNDAYMVNLYDQETGRAWTSMTDAQRAASAINGPDLTWNGSNANNNSSHLNASVSRTNGSIRMYAPNPYEQGSSVSHWDTSLSPDELMEPSATPTSDDRSTIQLLRDIGWSVASGPGEISFTSSRFSIAENSGPGRVLVQRSGGFEGATSVLVSSLERTASAGIDYTSINQTLSWADGESGVKTVSIPIIEDAIDEQLDETVGVILSNVTGSATISSPSSSTLTIREPSDGSEDFLLLTMPPTIAAIANATPPPPPVVVNPRWSVANEVCCSVSSATFRVSQGSQSLASTAQSCAVAAPQSSEVASTAGNKSFAYSLSSPGCGPLSGGFNFAFQNGTRYLFVAEFNGSGVDVGVFSGPIASQTSNSDYETPLSIEEQKKGLEFQRTIRLNNTDGDSSSYQNVGGEFRSLD